MLHSVLAAALDNNLIGIFPDHLTGYYYSIIYFIGHLIYCIFSIFNIFDILKEPTQLFVVSM